MMNPDPSAITWSGWACRCRSRKWRKNSSKGDPLGKSNGRSGIASPDASTLCAEEMVTTAGDTLAARSAKLKGAAGASAAATAPVSARTKALNARTPATAVTIAGTSIGRRVLPAARAPDAASPPGARAPAVGVMFDSSMRILPRGLVERQDAVVTSRHAIDGHGIQGWGGNAATENGITTPQAD